MRHQPWPKGTVVEIKVIDLILILNRVRRHFKLLFIKQKNMSIARLEKSESNEAHRRIENLSLCPSYIDIVHILERKLVLLRRDAVNDVEEPLDLTPVHVCVVCKLGELEV